MKTNYFKLHLEDAWDEAKPDGVDLSQNQISLSSITGFNYKFPLSKKMHVIGPENENDLFVLKLKGESECLFLASTEFDVALDWGEEYYRIVSSYDGSDDDSIEKVKRNSPMLRKKSSREKSKKKTMLSGEKSFSNSMGPRNKMKRTKSMMNSLPQKKKKFNMRNAKSKKKSSDQVAEDEIVGDPIGIVETTGEQMARYFDNENLGDVVDLRPDDYLTIDNMDNESVTDISPYANERNMDSIPCVERYKIVLEMQVTERNYVRQLHTMAHDYKPKLMKKVDAYKIEARDIDAMFSIIPVLEGLHETVLHSIEETVNNWKETSSIGSIFREFNPYLKMYSEYMNQYKTISTFYAKLLAENEEFRYDLSFIQREATVPLMLDDLLISPVQRVPRYSLYLQELIKNTSEDHVDREELEQSLIEVKAVAGDINEKVSKHELNSKLDSLKTQGFRIETLIEAHRFLIKFGLVKLNGEKKKFYFMLFNDIFLFVRKDLFKYVADLNNPQYVWPLDVVWIDILDNQILIKGPKRTLQLVDDDGWGNMILQTLKEYIEDKPHCTLESRHATFTYPNGFRYKGDWKDALYHGYGQFYEYGAKYRGNWDTGRRSGKGTQIYADGAKYIGSWFNNLRHGEGNFKDRVKGFTYTGGWQYGEMHGTGTGYYSNGDVYTGYWFGGIYNGLGKFVSRHEYETIYEGAFENGLYHGTGRISRSDGKEYVGEFEFGYFSGTGKLTLPDGSIYSGDFEKGERCGQGVCNGIDGSKYKGEWKNDVFWGNGKQIYPDKTIYDGSWENGMRSGFGKIMYNSTRNRYSGNWKNDKKHGTGSFTFENGDKYKGEFENDVIQGKGEMKYASGSRYKGYFQENKFHKSGLFTGTEDDWMKSYDGEWKLGEMQGKGHIIYQNGQEYKGYFKHNLYHGQGTIYLKKNVHISGKWEEGILEE